MKADSKGYLKNQYGKVKAFTPGLMVLDMRATTRRESRMAWVDSSDPTESNWAANFCKAIDMESATMW